MSPSRRDGVVGAQAQGRRRAELQPAAGDGVELLVRAPAGAGRGHHVRVVVHGPDGVDLRQQLRVGRVLRPGRGREQEREQEQLRIVLLILLK